MTTPHISAILAFVIAATSGLGAETHQFTPAVFYDTYSEGHPAALHLKSGDHVTTTTADNARAQTGPFVIDDAAPGDLIVVTIEELEPARTSVAAPSVVIGESVDAGALANKPAPPLEWTIDLQKRVARLDLRSAIPNVDWSTRYDPPVFELPLTPMLASIGVAAADGEPSVADAGPFGGNLEFVGVAPGARVMLPVFHQGAQLYLGHGIARQGDGNITAHGLETPMRVTFAVELVKKKEWPHSSVARASTVAGEFPIEWPRIESTEYVMTVASAATLEEALRHATSELHHWLDDDFGFSERSLSTFLGPAIEYQIANIADGHATVAAKVRRSFLPRIKSDGAAR